MGQGASLLVYDLNVGLKCYLHFPCSLFTSSGFRYYEGLQKCVGLSSESHCYSSEEVDRLETLYKSLGQQYSRSSAVKVTQPPLFLVTDKIGHRVGNYFLYFLGGKMWKITTNELLSCCYSRKPKIKTSYVGLCVLCNF